MKEREGEGGKRGGREKERERLTRRHKIVHSSHLSPARFGSRYDHLMVVMVRIIQHI